MLELYLVTDWSGDAGSLFRSSVSNTLLEKNHKNHDFVEIIFIREIISFMIIEQVKCYVQELNIEERLLFIVHQDKGLHFPLKSAKF